MNNLDIKGDEPVSPRSDAFFSHHGMDITSGDGFVEVNGNFSLGPGFFHSYERFKENKDEYLSEHNIKLK